MSRLATEAAAALILDELLGVADHELVAIVGDGSSPEPMVAALRAHLAGRGVETVIMTQPDRPAERKNLLNPAIARGLEGADVMVAITMSGGAPIYSSEVKALLDAKRLRFMSMVMRDMDIFTEGGATADYAALHREGMHLRDIWRRGAVMRITSEAGTDIEAPIGSDRVIVECGYAPEPGTSAAFSDGEVSSRPLEGQAEGVFVIDGPGAVIGMPDAPVRVVVERGRVAAIEGVGRAADTLRHIVSTVPQADNVAEFGIGLNPACRRNGKFEEEKKARGQVHIALGDNIFYGGTVRSEVHMDLVLRDPTVTLDGRLLVERGALRLGGA